MKKVFICLFLSLIALYSDFFVYPKSDRIDNVLGDYILSKNDKLVSLDLEAADLIDVLKSLSSQTGINFISSEAVSSRKITLFVDNVPLKKVLDILFIANRLTYDYYPDANIFIIKETGKPEVELKTKVYRLYNTWVKDSPIDKEKESIIYEEQSTGGSESTTGEGKFDPETVIAKVLTEYGRVTFDPVTNTVIVTDVPSQFPIIDEVIKRLDEPRVKIMIEVEMLDVNKRLIDKIGVDFGTGGYGLYGSYTGPSRTSHFPLPSHLWKAGGDKGEITLGTLDLGAAQNIVQFLSSDSTTKILARPRILTVAGETAEVNLSTNEVIGIVSTVDEGVTTYSPERENTGTLLRVTPYANLDTKDITLLVYIFNRDSSDSGLAITALSSGSFKNIEERGTKSILRLQDGETLLIGGLIKNQKTQGKNKVPILGDIPILGRAFTYESKDNQERELLVFLTPHIIEDRKSSQRFAFLEREQELYRAQSVSSVLDKFSKE